MAEFLLDKVGLTAFRDKYPLQLSGGMQRRAELARAWREEGVVLCPHTATAALLRRRLRAAGEEGALAVVATAHPSKFADVVEPLVGEPVPVPPPLQALLDRPSQIERLAADADALAARLDEPGGAAHQVS